MSLEEALRGFEKEEDLSCTNVLTKNTLNV